MGTIADKLNYILETKESIKQAIIDKGVEVIDTDTFRSYADKIKSIETVIDGVSVVDKSYTITEIDLASNVLTVEADEGTLMNKLRLDLSIIADLLKEV